MFRSSLCIAVLSCASFVPVHAAPDVVVLSSDITVSGLDHASADISARIRNIGTSSAVGTVVHFEVNGVPLATRMVPTIRSNNSASVSTRWNLTSTGRQEIRVRALPLNTANNSAVLVITTAVRSDDPSETRILRDTIFVTPRDTRAQHRDTRARPNADLDLRIEGTLTVQGSRPRVGKGGSVIRLRVVNDGPSKAKNVQIAANVNGTRHTLRNIGTIQAGRSRQVSINWKPRVEGPQTIEVVIDPNNRIIERIESNNSATLDVTAEPKGKRDRDRNDDENDD